MEVSVRLQTLSPVRVAAHSASTYSTVLKDNNGDFVALHTTHSTSTQACTLQPTHTDTQTESCAQGQGNQFHPASSELH